MKKFKLNIGSRWIGTNDARIRVVDKVRFGHVVYKIYIQEAGLWADQITTYSLFRKNIDNGKYVEFTGEIPKYKIELV